MIEVLVPQVLIVGATGWMSELAWSEIWFSGMLQGEVSISAMN